jgi:hypothetical protein
MKNIGPLKETWNLKKAIVVATLALGWLLLGAHSQTASAAPALLGETVSNSSGHPGDVTLASSLPGADFEETGSYFFEGTSRELQADNNLTANILLPVIVIVAVGAGGLIFIAGVSVAGVFTWSFLKKKSGDSRAMTESPATGTVSVFQQAGQPASQQTEQDFHLSEAARTSGDPNDPGVQATQKKYQGDIERQRQARQQGPFNRQRDCQVRQSRQHLAPIKARQKKARSRRHQELIEVHINVDLAEAEMHTAFNYGFTQLSSGLAYIKSGADFVIDTFADINPSAGKLIQTGYKAGGGMEGVNGSLQEPGNWFRTLTRSTAKGLLDAPATRLNSNMVNGLPPQLRAHVIFRGARLSHDPLHLPSFLELPGRPAALPRGIFNAALTRSTDPVNPVIWARDVLKNLISR